eukprot:1764628-Rhodomonas_salina.1
MDYRIPNRVRCRAAPLRAGMPWLDVQQADAAQRAEALQNLAQEDPAGRKFFPPTCKLATT